MKEYFYNVDFEIAAIVFLAVFELLVNSKKHLNTRQNVMYRGMICFFLLANILDLCACLINNYSSTDLLFAGYALNILISIGLICLVQSFLLYCIEVIERADILKKSVFWLFNIPSVVFVTAIILTPFNHFVFWISESNKYVRGAGHTLIYGIIVYNLIQAFVIATVIGRKADRKKRAVCQLFSVLVLTGCIVQWVFISEIVIIPLFEIVAILVLHFFIQSPEYYLDKGTNVFNEQGFIRLVREKTLRQESFSVLAVCFDELSVSGNAILEQKLLKEVCQYVSAIKGISCFRADREIYIYCKKSEMAEQIGSDIIERTKECFFVDSTPYFLDAKILIMYCPKDIHNINDVLSAIKFFRKQEMEYHKIYYYAGSVMKKIQRYEGIKNILTDAIRNKGIQMYYQPIYSVETGRLDSAEALVRLKDNVTYGFISPDEFIPIAEEENLILELEELILEQVCRFIQTEKLVEKGLRYLEINLSGKQCEEKNLAYKLASVVEKCNIPAHFVNFEITETAAFDMDQHLLYNMEKLIDQGYSFSLDDFGSGYSNLKHLSELPIKIAKLDKALVWSYFQQENEKSKSVLIYTIKMLRKLGLEIVAEGVETKEQKEELIRLNVQHLQGYYFSKPVPEKEFLRILKQQEI